MKKAAIILGLVLMPVIAAAQQGYSKLLSDYIVSYHAVHELSGSVLVTKKGQVLYEQSFGEANREWKIPNSKNTRFWLASISKQFTAAAILQLEEKGKLSTSDKLSKFFPNYPKADSITLHMLLNHTSGIKECSADPQFFRIDEELSGAALKDSLLATFKNKPFDFEPGTFWRYSNSGYILLGYIIEQVSGQKYDDYLTRNVIQRAGMANAGVLQFGAVVPQLADAYSKNGQTWTKARHMQANVQNRVGGVYATARDLQLWRDALRSGKVINVESYQKMNQPNHPERGSGYGIFVDQIYGHKVLQHQGAGFGINTFMAEFPEDGISIIVLTNRDTNLDFLPKALAGILLDKKVESAYKRIPANIDPTLLTRYVGEYEGDGLSYPINLVTKDNKLFLKLRRDIELIPESDAKFFIDEPDVEIQIEFASASNKVFFIESGIRTEIRRK